MSDTPVDRQKHLAPVLIRFVEINLLLVLLCCIAEAFCRDVLHLAQPYNYPVLDPNYSFGDFRVYQGKFQFLHHPSFFNVGMPFMYPAPAAPMYDLFYLSHSHAVRMFLIFILGSFTVAAILLWRALSRRGLPAIKAVAFIVSSMALAYPLWFEIKQGNIEIWVWVWIALGVWAFCSGNDYSAAACFGIAASVKIFPLVYLGILLAKRKYRQIAFAALVAVTTTIASLWFIEPDLSGSWRGIQAGLDKAHSNILLYWPGYMGSDHSLFGAYKRFAHSHMPRPEIMGHILTIYLCVAAVGGVALYFARIRQMPLINQVLCLCVASILLAPISYDYTLIHLYVPWAMLVLFAQNRWNAKQKIPGLTAAFVCLAILVSPETEFIHHREGLGGQIKALVLIVLFYIALKYPFETGTCQENEVAAL